MSTTLSGLRPAVLLLALLPLSGLAHGRAARLLDAADVPLAMASVPASLVPLVPQAAEVELEAPTYGVHFIKTYGVSVVGVGAGLVVGFGLGKLSTNLIVTALATLLPNLLIGPALTVLAAMMVGNGGSLEGRYGFWGAFGVAALLNAAAYVVSSLFLSVSLENPVGLVLYLLVDGLLMTGGSVGLMHLLQPKPVSAVVPSFVPGVSDTQVVSMGKVEF